MHAAYLPVVCDPIDFLCFLLRHFLLLYGVTRDVWPKRVDDAIQRSHSVDGLALLKWPAAKLVQWRHYHLQGSLLGSLEEYLSPRLVTTRLAIIATQDVGYSPSDPRSCKSLKERKKRNQF